MYAKVFQYKFPSITEAKVAASFCSDNLGKQITKFNFQSLNIMIGKEGDLSIFIKFNTIDKLKKFENERRKYNDFNQNPDKVESILLKGAKKASQVGDEVLNRFRKKLGFN